MTAIINGIKVEGTPEEIKQLIDACGENKSETADDLNDLSDWSTPYLRRMGYPHPTHYYDPWWGIYPPYDGLRDTGIEYLHNQPTCTSSTSAFLKYNY